MNPSQVLDCRADLIARLERPMVRRAWTHQLTMDYSNSLLNVDGNYIDEKTKLNDTQARSNAAAMLDILTRASRDAESYYVTEDMTSLVVHAATELDNSDRFLKQLAPSRTGIAYFEKPLTFNDVRGKQLKISWMAWAPVLAHVVRGDTMEPQEQMGIFVWNDHLESPDDIALLWPDQFGVEDYEFILRTFGRWGFIGVETFWDGMKLGPALVDMGDRKRAQILADGDTPHEFTNMARLVHAFWMLLGQTIVHLDPDGAQRPFVRRAKRMNIPHRVTVIQLRRMEGARHPGETMVEWHHRWVVKGHWRWQPYGPRPKLHEHAYGPVRIDGRVMVRECGTCEARVERIWIAPFIKGPDGKPLVISDKVYALAR